MQHEDQDSSHPEGVSTTVSSSSESRHSHKNSASGSFRGPTKLRGKRIHVHPTSADFSASEFGLSSSAPSYETSAFVDRRRNRDDDEDETDSFFELGDVPQDVDETFGDDLDDHNALNTSATHGPLFTSFSSSTRDRSPTRSVISTRNNLAPEERGALLRKNRKLAQMLGTDPGSLTSHFSFLKIHQRGSSEQLKLQPVQSAPARASPLSPSANIGFLRHQDYSPRSSARKSTRETGSFMEMSDNEMDEGHTDQSPEAESSVPTVLTEEETADRERRQRRSRLAKVHRFLGSGVPAELVLGVSGQEKDLDLPAVSAPPDLTRSSPPSLRPRVRRRSSSAAFPSWEDPEGPRIKEELSEFEKSRNVKRAVKMEKVFGQMPPQTLYHTRAPGSNPQITLSATSPDVRGTLDKSGYSKYAEYLRGFKPTTSVPRDSIESHQSGRPLLQEESETYSRIRQSIISLTDIVDRDDRESLLALHDLISPSSENVEEQEESEDIFSFEQERIASGSGLRTERRLSLPITRKDSLLSLRSQFTVSSPPAEITDFQTRRKRAAKLVDFFGVNYNELLEVVVGKIENGVREEGKRGSLKPDEIDVRFRPASSIQADHSF
ncbi:hypothetical protein SISNIDRAFT_438684 [Sistotremastrum niveocremeum HHB9708]|uniref:Uncharacterized protein n=1 Tax=Sistotremastrum niveocremeum HHB9708 TaxID=1314777 RepID=A0A164XKZ0_9AGAM|nr:hypothetical protein SISNIDRAFT_438684 [Sistotremastrum niveocremeum HHB9708]